MHNEWPSVIVNLKSVEPSRQLTTTVTHLETLEGITLYPFGESMAGSVKILTLHKNVFGYPGNYSFSQSYQRYLEELVNLEMVQFELYDEELVYTATYIWDRIKAVIRGIELHHLQKLKHLSFHIKWADCDESNDEHNEIEGTRIYLQIPDGDRIVELKLVRREGFISKESNM